MAKKENKPLRAVIYARTSVDDGDLAREAAKQKAETENDSPQKKYRRSRDRVNHKESISEQLAECRHKCEDLNYEVVGEYWDQNFSGRTYPLGHHIKDRAFDAYYRDHIGRPNKQYRKYFGELLDKISQFDIIIVRDIFRLVRPTARSFLDNHIWQILHEHGIKIFSLQDGFIDVSKYEDLMTTGIKLEMADQAKQSEINAAKRSLRKKKDEGLLASGVKCYGFESCGYQNVRPVEGQLKTVRFIFDEGLKGTPILVITRKLNDDRRTHVPWVTATSANNKEARHKPWKPIWCNRVVRNILGRPYYCGLTHNSAGVLIPSQIFPQEPDSVITKNEYYQMQALLKENVTKAHKGQTSRGGSEIGRTLSQWHSHDRIIHPLTGLVFCGYCKKHMYIGQSNNPFYDKKAESTKSARKVTVYRYFCKNPQLEGNQSAGDCRFTPIIETYPEGALKYVSEPLGNGLLEAIFPLLFMGYVSRYTEEKKHTPELAKQRAVLGGRLDDIQKTEQALIVKLSKGIITDEQYDNSMLQFQKDRQEVTSGLIEVDKQITATKTGHIAVSKDFFLKPHLIAREKIKELAHEAFEAIYVYADKIELVFKNGHHFPIERVRQKNSRLLPFWRARIDSEEITSKTRLGVVYYYKSTSRGIYDPAETLYADDRLEVVTFGQNGSLDKKRSEFQGGLSDLDRILGKLFGPPPTHQRQLEFDSSAFFTGKLPDMGDVREV